MISPFFSMSPSTRDAVERVMENARSMSYWNTSESRCSCRYCTMGMLAPDIMESGGTMPFQYRPMRLWSALISRLGRSMPGEFTPCTRSMRALLLP